jgi:uncharacterized ubiquitin-like protein YukD
MSNTEQKYTIDGSNFVKSVIDTFCPDYGSYKVSLNAIDEIICGHYGLLVANKQNKINTTIIVKNSDSLLGKERKLLEDAINDANEYYDREQCYTHT